MRDNNKNMIYIIIITILLLIILFVLLMKLNKQDLSKSNNTENEMRVDYYNTYITQRASEGVTADDAVASLEDNPNQYYTIKKIIDNFNTYVGYLNTTVSDLGLIVSEGKESEALQEYRQNGLTMISNMLANNYKTKYSVNDNYLYNILKNYSGKKYEITDMYIVEDSAYINTYFIYGNYTGIEFNYIIILDKYNYTFEVYLDNFFKENNYSKDNISTMKTLHIEKIEKNENNTFQYQNINREQLSLDYFEDYLNKMQNNIQAAYDLLDEEYRKSRFKDILDFQTYVSEVINTDFVKNNNPRLMVGYTITNYDNYTEYICKDNYGNNFIFKSTGIMKYTVILDTYTVAVDSYEKEYESSEDAKKAQLCLNRFFECLNNKDYEQAYNYLNSTYRENNFKTVDEFEKYIKSKWFEFNSFSYINVQTNEQYYMLSGQINDITTDGSYNAKHIQKTFVVKLGTNIKDFQVSFER